ncbi:hypothetical protein RFI_33635 [Reticulomyxa filosa]|uniref:Uncharacterized protein n=1 Tax=Reticulomyxa filosa TaxID=46433 RepID=X6LRK6_RETFI|nr:hypothetical protein RFI_33635 [Reticulomyxa filosa]|eukprot:ETO03767.1 hypothetical protein RFI_33635 [Reticulomyxa filosa]
MPIIVTINNGIQTDSIGLQVKVQVEPDIGLMTFTLGTILSQVYSHVFLYWDQKYARPQYIKWLRKRQALQLQVADQQSSNKLDFENEAQDEAVAIAAMSDLEEQGQGQGQEDLEREHNGSSAALGSKELDLPLLAEKIIEMETSDKHISQWFDRSFVRESRFFSEKHPWNNQYMPFAYRYVPKSMFGIAVRSVFLVAMVFNGWALYNSIICAPVRYDIEGLTGVY